MPFYIASPVTTLDLKMASGDSIIIEERAHHELTQIAGVQIAADGIDVWNPQFDVTPGALITGIVTERGVISPSADGCT